MRLEAFTDNNFNQLIHWINSEELNYLWGGSTYSYPLTYSQIMSHCSQLKVIPFIFVVSGINVGFIELFHVSDSHYRICRVFIADEYRGKGLSKKMIESTIAKAHIIFHCNVISLAVFSHNIVAKKCYASLGFKEVSIELDVRRCVDKPWDLIRMEKQLL